MKAEGKPEEYGKEKMLDLERWKFSDKVIKVVLRWFEALWQKIVNIAIALPGKVAAL